MHVIPYMTQKQFFVINLFIFILAHTVNLNAANDECELVDAIISVVATLD